MGRRNNTVRLEGFFWVDQVEMITTDDENIHIAYCRMKTDFVGMGGVHIVEATHRLASECMAFFEVNNFQPLETIVNGYLWSEEGSCKIIADQIKFELPDRMRQSAKGVLKTIWEGTYWKDRSIRDPIFYDTQGYEFKNWKPTHFGGNANIGGFL